ncbi:MAG: branched-chain amino acid ABC transporter permease [Candidatus Competibacteraceae bacterium]|nr:branched-chain amino acid ABC transporter permease [Candidatus Competibacteraceae bacterium]
MRLAGFLLFAAVVLLLPVLFPNNYFVTVVGVAAGLHVILAVGLNLLMGYAGQISLGHAAFFGMGGYASAILTTRFDWPGWLALLAGLLVAGTIAWLLARPILRLRGHYLAMATLGFGIIIHVILVQATEWTGGPDGLGSIPPLNLLGWTVDSDAQWYWVIAAAMLLVIWLSLNIVDSRIGRALRAVRGSELAAQMMGIDTARAKTQVFVVSALFAAFAGSLFAHQQAFVSPDSFSLMVSVELVTMVVLGGMASTFGAACGAIALTLLHEGLVVFEDYEMLIHGALLMAVMIFLPQGLFVGLTQGVRRGWALIHEANRPS